MMSQGSRPSRSASHSRLEGSTPRVARRSTTSSPSRGESFSQPIRQDWACETAHWRSASTGPSKRRTCSTSMPVLIATSAAVAPARM